MTIQLYRVKIRVYNQVFPQHDTPEGQFQGFFDLDAPLDPVTGEPDLSYWLTQKEIKAAKRDMHAEFNQPTIWIPDESKITYYVERENQVLKGSEGIPFSGEKIVREPKYGVKQIPKDLLGKFTIGELITGLSTIAPVPILEPEGAYKKRLLVLKENEINWDSGDLSILVYFVMPSDRERWRAD